MFSIVATLVAIVVLCGSCVHLCAGQTYNDRHNLVIQGKTITKEVTINRPTGYVIVRNCKITKMLRVSGSTSNYANLPQELMIIIEDLTMSETINIRYLNLVGNSTVTVRNIKSANTKADFSIARMILNGASMRFENMVQTYFYYRWVTMTNGSTVDVVDYTMPTKSAFPKGYLWFDEVFVRDNSAIAFDNVVFGYLLMEASSFTASKLTFSNSRIQSQQRCWKTNCHLNFTTSTLNNAELSFYNTSIVDAAVKVFGTVMTNKTQVKMIDSSIVGNEMSAKRARQGFHVNSASRVESGTVINITSTPITLQPVGNIRVTIVRGVQFGNKISFSSLVIHNSKITAYRGKGSNGNPLYILGVEDSTLDIDQYTYTNLSPGASYLQGLEGLVKPLNFSGVYNPPLILYLKGSMDTSIYADNANIRHLETDSGVISGHGVGVFVRNSTLQTLRFDTNALFDNFATLEVLDCTLTSLVFNSVSFTGSSTINFRRIDLSSAFTWPTGSLRSTTAVFESINFPKTLALEVDVDSGSSLTIANSTLGNVEMTGNSISSGSSVIFSNNTINVTSTSSVGTITGFHFRSGKIQSGTIGINDNVIFVNRSSKGTPSPLDLVLGIYLEGTVLISGTSAVQYLRNDVTAVQNGVFGMSIRHDAPSTGVTSIEYGPPVPSAGPSVAKDVVQLRLDKNATLVADWCTMWNVAALALSFIDAGQPLVLNGVDSTGIEQLTLDCGGGSGALPVSLSNSKFAGLAITRCIVDDAAPFVMQNSKISGKLTWGQTSVAHAASAVLFNVSIGGGIVNTNPGARDPTEVERPPEMLNQWFAGVSPWNTRPCYAPAPRFSYTPSATASGPTPSTSPSLSTSSTVTPADTATPSSSVTHEPTPTVNPPRTPTLTLPPTPTATRPPTPSVSVSLPGSETVELSLTTSLGATGTPPLTETVIPPPRTPTTSRTSSLTATPPQTRSETESSTISHIPCYEVAPVVNETTATTTEEDLLGGAKTFHLHIGPLAMYAAAIHASADETEVVLNATAFSASWSRSAATDLPSGMPVSGPLPPSAVSLSVVHHHLGPGSGYLKLTLDLNVLDQQELQFDQVYPTDVIVNLQPDFFMASYCGYRATAGLILIEATPDTLLDAANALLQGVGDVAAVSSVIAGGGSAGDAISLAILADMSCARPVVRASGHNQRLLSPAAFDSTLPGMLYGSLLLVVLVPILHVVATLGYAKHAGISHARLIVAMAVTRFPSWTFGSLMVLHQGVTYVSLKILFVESGHGGGASVAAVIGLIFAIVAPPVFVFVAARYITATYVRYDFDATPEEQRPSAFWRGVLPRGRWEVREVRTAYGVMLAPFERPHPMWAAYMFASPSLVAIIAVPSPGSSSGCAVQYAFMSFVLAVYGLLAFVFRPFRSAVINGLSGTSTGSLFGVASMSLVQAATGGNVNVKVTGTLTVLCVFLQMFTTCARVGYVIFMTMCEAKHTMNLVLRPVGRRTPDDVWLAFPFIGMISDSFAKRRLRAEMQAERGANKLPETFKVPPRMTAKPSELEEALLKKGKPYDPAILANVNIIDVAALDDVDALLDEKALPDHLLRDDDNEHNWSITDGPAGWAPEDEEGVAIAINTSCRFAGTAGRTADTCAAIEDREAVEDEGAAVDSIVAAAGKSRSNSILKLLSSTTATPPGTKTEDPLEVTEEPNQNPSASSPAETTPRSAPESGSQTPGARSSGAPSEAEYSAATVGMDQFAHNATRKKSVSFAPDTVVELITEEEMTPRTVSGETSPAPEPIGAAAATEGDTELIPKVAPDAKSAKEVTPDEKPRFVSLHASDSFNRYPHSPPQPFAPTRTPSPDEQATSAPTQKDALDEAKPNPAPVSGPQAATTHDSVAPDVTKKRDSIFDIASFDPSNPRNLDEKAPSSSDSSSPLVTLPPLPSSVPATKRETDLKAPPLAQKDESVVHQDAKDVSSEWVVVPDRTAAQLLEVPKRPSIMKPKRSGGRRRSLSVDFVWSSSQGSPPQPFAADPPLDSSLAPPKMNPLMAAVGQSNAAPSNPLMAAVPSAPSRGRGATQKSSGLPSIYDMLPPTSRQPMEKERVLPRERSFTTTEAAKLRRMSRGLSLSL